jgi:hypothetical protein
VLALSESNGLVATRALVDPMLAPVLVKEIVAPCTKPSMLPLDVTVKAPLAVPTGIILMPLLKIVSDAEDAVLVMVTVPKIILATFRIDAAEVSTRLALASLAEPLNVKVLVLWSDRKTFAPVKLVVTVSVLDALVRNGVPIEPMVELDVRLMFSAIKPTTATVPDSVSKRLVEELIRLTRPEPEFICPPT